MSEQVIAMIAAGIGVVATIVTWVFYIVVGKSLWDLRKFVKGTPGGGRTGRSGKPDTRQEPSEQ